MSKKLKANEHTERTIDPNGGQYVPFNPQYDSGYSDGYKAAKERIKELEKALAEAQKAAEFNFQQYQDVGRLLAEECEKNERATSDHVFYKTGDGDAPEQIKDRNGEVVLSLCRKCGQAEGDLEEACPAVSAEPVYVIFDGPPSHDAPRFVEVEDAGGFSKGGFEWSLHRGTGYWRLGPFYPSPPSADAKDAALKLAKDALNSCGRNMADFTYDPKKVVKAIAAIYAAMQKGTEK